MPCGLCAGSSSKGLCSSPCEPFLPPAASFGRRRWVRLGDSDPDLLSAEIGSPCPFLPLCCGGAGVGALDGVTPSRPRSISDLRTDGTSVGADPECRGCDVVMVVRVITNRVAASRRVSWLTLISQGVCHCVTLWVCISPLPYWYADISAYMPIYRGSWYSPPSVS